MSPFGSEGRSADRENIPCSENRYKILVKVRADHNTDGSIRPLAFLTPEGEKVLIHKVLDVRQAASLKAGGQGTRYDVRVECGEAERRMYLFDDDGVWFIEKD